jgi:hypothetical protein
MKDTCFVGFSRTVVCGVHVPPGIALSRVRQSDGLPAQPGDKRVVLEALRPGTRADRRRDGARSANQQPARPTPAVAEGIVGGLY